MATAALAFFLIHLTSGAAEPFERPEEPPVESVTDLDGPEVTKPAPIKRKRERGAGPALTAMLVAGVASAGMGVAFGVATAVFLVAALVPAFAIGNAYVGLLGTRGGNATPLLLLAPLILPLIAVTGAVALSIPAQATAALGGWAAATLAHGWRSALLQTVVPSVVIVSVPAVLLGGLATAAAVGGVVLGIGAYGTGSVLLGPLAAAMFLFPVAALFSLVAPLLIITTQVLGAVVLGVTVGARGRRARSDEPTVNMDVVTVPE